MLQSMGSQTGRRDLVTEQQQLTTTITTNASYHVIFSNN